jgi:hypothetical protein
LERAWPPGLAEKSVRVGLGEDDRVFGLSLLNQQQSCFQPTVEPTAFQAVVVQLSGFRSRDRHPRRGGFPHKPHLRRSEAVSGVHEIAYLFSAS